MYRLLLFILLSVAMLPAKGQSISFEEGTWEETLKKAKAENKLVFLDAYASWCGPCKWMAANVFTDAKAGAYYNLKFVNAKIDMEKGEGLELAKKYGVSAFPTLLYIDGDGNVVHRTCGSSTVETFIENGSKALDPQRRLSYFNGIYSTGSFGAPFLSRYLNMLSESCSPGVNDVAHTYLAKVKEEDLPLPENWQIINRYVTDIDSREFKYLARHPGKFKGLQPNEVENKIFNTYVDAAGKYFGKPVNEEGYAGYKKQIQASGYNRSAEVLMQTDMNYYRKKADWKNYALAAEKYFSSYDVKDPNLLNEAAWNVYEKLDDKASIKNALKWIEKSVKLDDGPANNDTYAALLLKAGRKSEALKAEQKALELAKAAGEDTAPYEEMIKKIQESK